MANAEWAAPGGLRGGLEMRGDAERSVPAARPTDRAVHGRTDLERAVLEVVAHSRYRGAFMPVWRIRAALSSSTTPGAVRRALEMLELGGQVERRHLAGPVEWRRAPGGAGADLAAPKI